MLSTTFDKYCYVNVRHLPPFFSYATELSYAKTERVNSLEEIEHPAIRNAMKMLDMHHIRLTYEADLPARSGLGTSSSFAVGMLNAFEAKKTLIVTAESNEAVYKSARNIEGVTVMPVNNINVYDLLKYPKVIMTKDAVSKIEEVYA